MTFVKISRIFSGLFASPPVHFKTGDVVCLKSGGVAMTVVAGNPNGDIWLAYQFNGRIKTIGPMRQEAFKGTIP